MVDFQSRDTSRGRSEDEDEDENEESENGDDATSDGDEIRGTDTESTRTDEAETAGGDVDGGGGGEGGAAGAIDDTVGDAGTDHHEHEHGAHDHVDAGQLGIAVVTVSSSRTREDDPSGDAIASYVREADHEVVTRDLVTDDLDGVQRAVLALTGRDDVDVVVTTGGTGVTPDDVTVEAVEPLFDKELPGFGELFRILSHEEVGTRAVSTRATAGISEGVPVFCLPGSEAAVRLGMEELILEEVGHLVALAAGD